MGKTPSKKSPFSLSENKNKGIISFITNIWDNYRWELFVIISLITIFICWIFKPDDEEYKGISIDTSVLKIKHLSKDRVYKNEEKCREIIEKIYNKPFKKIRPNFLKNPKTGRNLELDMYNEELNIAVEYNGIQHRTYAPYFHKSLDDYNSQVERDIFKSKKCLDYGITLIIVPDTVRYHEIEDHIIKELKRNKRLH